MFSVLISNLYPHNPEAVHKCLPELFDRFPMLKDNNQTLVLNIVMTVSNKNPKVNYCSPYNKSAADNFETIWAKI